MGKNMKNAPVYFVLAQIRFNAVLTLDGYIPVIQDFMRKAGYADFGKAITATINLNMNIPASANQLPVGQMIQYLFLNEGKTSGFILDQTSITYQTTEYDTFDPFKDAFIAGLKTVDTAVGGLTFSERVGMRFLDAISARPGEAITDYFAPSLVGMFDKLRKRQLKHIISETWSTLDKSTLVCRAIIQNQSIKGVSFAPDLIPVVLQVAEKFRELTGIYGIVDTDSWYENRQKFDLDKIEKLLVDIHGDIRGYFDEMVTPHALRVWE